MEENKEYSDIRTICDKGDWLVVVGLLQQQRPWHSKIKLPQKALKPGSDPNISCYDVDVLIVTVRMLLSLGFVTEDEYANSPVLQCAYHDFGSNRDADYAVKGMLVSKLFPNDDDPSTLKQKLTIERLFDHPEVKRAIFSSFTFALKNTQEFVGPKDASRIEELNEIVHDPDLSHVRWDGSCDIEEAVSDQAWSICPEIDNEDRYHVRYSGRPRFVRVTYEPRSEQPPRFEDIKRFKLTAPCLLPKEDGTPGRPQRGNDTYFLCTVIRVGRESGNSTHTQTEIRLYDVEGDPIREDKECDAEFRASWETKLRRERLWTVGNKLDRYILFYCRMGSMGWQRSTTPPPPRGTIGEKPKPQLNFSFFRPHDMLKARDSLRGARLMETRTPHNDSVDGQARSAPEDVPNQPKKDYPIRETRHLVPPVAERQGLSTHAASQQQAPAPTTQALTDERPESRARNPPGVRDNSHVHRESRRSPPSATQRGSQSRLRGGADTYRPGTYNDNRSRHYDDDDDDRRRDRDDDVGRRRQSGTGRPPGQHVGPRSHPDGRERGRFGPPPPFNEPAQRNQRGRGGRE